LERTNLVDEVGLAHLIEERGSNVKCGARVSPEPWRRAKPGEINGTIACDTTLITCVQCLTEEFYEKTRIPGRPMKTVRR
jgi:hypothetical protein